MIVPVLHRYWKEIARGGGTGLFVKKPKEAAANNDDKESSGSDTGSSSDSGSSSGSGSDS